jgi:hypothetical protein
LRCNTTLKRGKRVRGKPVRVAKTLSGVICPIALDDQRREAAAIASVAARIGERAHRNG